MIRSMCQGATIIKIDVKTGECIEVWINSEWTKLNEIASNETYKAKHGRNTIEIMICGIISCLKCTLFAYRISTITMNVKTVKMTSFQGDGVYVIVTKDSP